MTPAPPWQRSNSIPPHDMGGPFDSGSSAPSHQAAQRRQREPTEVADSAPSSRGRCVALGRTSHCRPQPRTSTAAVRWEQEEKEPLWAGAAGMAVQSPAAPFS
jgi:hypothetical protein